MTLPQPFRSWVDLDIDLSAGAPGEGHKLPRPASLIDALRKGVV
jgi:hypothetical protein